LASLNINDKFSQEKKDDIKNMRLSYMTAIAPS
jgi:hypothetical protein